MRKLKVSIELEFTDKKIANTVYNAILPEIRNPPSKRAVVELNLKDNKISLNISTTTISSLRAAINSYLRWIYSISETCRKLVKENG